MTTPASPQRLRQHLEALSEPRNSTTHLEAHRAARRYLEGFLRAHDRVVTRQTFETPAHGTGVNLLVPPLGEEAPTFLVVAHYDTVDGSPGADDNTSAVAVALELGARCPKIALLFPDLEESGLQGVRHFAAQKTWMEVPALVLESVGYWSDHPGSQTFPAILPAAFPEQHQKLQERDLRGDFLALLNLPNERNLAQRLEHSLGHGGIRFEIPAEMLGAPGGEALRDFGRSDHLAFWEMGRPCLMLTDSANFRSPGYHSPEDTAEKLDFERMAELTRILASFLEDM